MAYTGGPLNELNGKMGISAPYKSSCYEAYKIP